MTHLNGCNYDSMRSDQHRAVYQESSRANRHLLASRQNYQIDTIETINVSFTQAIHISDQPSDFCLNMLPYCDFDSLERSTRNSHRQPASVLPPLTPRTDIQIYWQQLKVNPRLSFRCSVARLHRPIKENLFLSTNEVG